jgi:hypothetical protein
LLTKPRFLDALALGLFIHVATLLLPGHDDVIAWTIWSYAAAREGPAVYGVGGAPPPRGLVSWGRLETTVNYPPVFLYEYAIVGHIYQALYPAYPDSPALLVAVKLPVLAASMGLTALLFFAVRRISGRDEPARWAALAYWLNPAAIVGGEMLGYVDPLYYLPAIAGLVLAYLKRPWSAGACVAIAVATKPQGILIGPAFALALWQADGLPAIAQASTTFLGTLTVAVLPFYIRGALPNMWLAFGSFDERRDTMSALAANVGWIANWWLRSRSSLAKLGFPKAYLQKVANPLSITRFRELGYFDPRPLSRTAVIAAVSWASWATRQLRNLPIAAAVGAFTVHAFFVLSPNVHESHQLFEVPLLVMAAALRPRFRPLLAAVSAIVTLNINYVYGAGIGMGWNVPRMITGIDLSVLLSFTNVGVLLWFACRVWSESREAIPIRQT